MKIGSQEVTGEVLAETLEFMDKQFPADRFAIMLIVVTDDGASIVGSLDAANTVGVLTKILDQINAGEVEMLGDTKPVNVH